MKNLAGTFIFIDGKDAIQNNVTEQCKILVKILIQSIILKDP